MAKLLTQRDNDGELNFPETKKIPSQQLIPRLDRSWSGFGSVELRLRLEGSYRDVDRCRCMSLLISKLSARILLIKAERHDSISCIMII